MRYRVVRVIHAHILIAINDEQSFKAIAAMLLLNSIFCELARQMCLRIESYIFVPDISGHSFNTITELQL